MGLDSFWVHPENKEHPTFFPSLFLCGGLFSDHGSGSFRGKVYNSFIESTSGVSLYQERIPNETVQKIAEALEAHAGRDGFEDDEYLDLVRMFKAYATAGFELHGWW